MLAVIQLAIAAITAKIADIALPEVVPANGSGVPRLLNGARISDKFPAECQGAARHLPQRPLGEVQPAVLATGESRGDIFRLQ